MSPQLTRLYKRLEAARLHAGLSGNYQEMDHIYDLIQDAHDDERRQEAERKLRRQRAITGIIEYRKLRQAFTV